MYNVFYYSINLFKKCPCSLVYTSFLHFPAIHLVHMLCRRIGMFFCFDNIFLVFNVTVTTTKIRSQSTSILTQPITESHTTTPSTSTFSNKSMMSTIYVSGSRLTTYHTSERSKRGRHSWNCFNVEEHLTLYPKYRGDMFNYLTHARATSAYSLRWCFSVNMYLE